MQETLPEYPVIQQLYNLFLTSATGRIDFTYFGETCNLWLKNGSPVAAELLNHNVNPLQIAMEIGLIKQQALSNIKISATETIITLKEKLISGGFINEDNFSLLMKEKIRREFAALCLSKEKAQFIEGAECTENYIPSPINGFGALFFVFQFYSTPDQIAKMEQNYQGSTLVPNANFIQIRFALDMPTHISTSLEQWSHPRSLSDLYLVSGMNNREVVAVVAILELVNALDVKKENGSANKAPSPVSQTETTKPAPKPNTQTPQKPAATENRKPAKSVSHQQKSPKDQELLDEANKYIEILKSHNPLKILGVKKDSSSGEIKKSYALLARKFHPDKISGSAIEHMKKDFEKIFAEIGNAYQTLTKPDLREEFFECLKDPIIQGNLQRLDQRKRAVFEKQKTEILFKKRDFLQTVSTAKRALAIFPYDPEILIMLGWSIFNSVTDKQKAFAESEKYFDRALKILPSFAVGHYFKGLVYKAVGDKANAKTEFELAVKYDPQNKEAAQELHGL